MESYPRLDNLWERRCGVVWMSPVDEININLYLVIRVNLIPTFGYVNILIFLLSKLEYN